MYTIEEFDKMKTKVLKYVLFKKRTEYEVMQKFKNTIEPNLLEDIIQDLKENSYINDDEYINRAVSEFIAINTLSIKEIKYKLRSKGVSSSLIEDYIDKNYEELIEYEKDNAYKIFQKKKLSQDADKIKNYLRSKGYLDENIKQVVNGGE